MPLRAGEPAAAPGACRVVEAQLSATGDVSSVSLRLVREVWEERTSVSAWAATNFTYTLVTTNAVLVGTNAVVVAATNTAAFPPVPLPPNAVSVTTNAIVTAWATTNTAPALAAAWTNSVLSGLSASNGLNRFAAPDGLRALPGDFFLLECAGGEPLRADVVVER